MQIVLVLLLIATLAVPGPRANSQSNTENIRAIKIPKGTPVEVELVYDISSGSIEKGDGISFRAVSAVTVDGIQVIASGASTTAVVNKVSRRRYWGRGGQIAFTMRDIVAVDEQKIPLQFDREVTGEGKIAEVSTKIAATGVLLWPIAPVALLWGLKRGKHAIIPAGKRFVVLTKADVTVKVIEPK